MSARQNLNQKIDDQKVARVLIFCNFRRPRQKEKQTRKKYGLEKNLWTKDLKNLNEGVVVVGSCVGVLVPNGGSNQHTYWLLLRFKHFQVFEILIGHTINRASILISIHFDFHLKNSPNHL